MIAFLRSLFRHVHLPDLGAYLVANLACLVPFLAALIGPIALRGAPELGLAVFVAGFLLTGQAIAVSGRLLDTRFQKEKRAVGALGRAWRQAWAEGLVVSALFFGMFSLLFQSVPFYWQQGDEFALFSLFTLALGSVLVLGFLPYYLPARRREGLSLGRAIARAFRLMNAFPGLALAGFVLGALVLVTSLATLGVFPGFAGLTALHQGLWDHATEKEASAES